MKAFVNDSCIGCGLCESTCSAVFRMNDNGVAEAIDEVPEDQEDAAREACDGCPVAAIELS